MFSLGLRALVVCLLVAIVAVQRTAAAVGCCVPVTSSDDENAASAVVVVLAVPPAVVAFRINVFTFGVWPIEPRDHASSWSQPPWPSRLLLYSLCASRPFCLAPAPQLDKIRPNLSQKPLVEKPECRVKVACCVTTMPLFLLFLVHSPTARSLISCARRLSCCPARVLS